MVWTPDSGMGCNAWPTASRIMTPLKWRSPKCSCWLPELRFQRRLLRPLLNLSVTRNLRGRYGLNSECPGYLLTRRYPAPYRQNSVSVAEVRCVHSVAMRKELWWPTVSRLQQSKPIVLATVAGADNTIPASAIFLTNSATTLITRLQGREMERLEGGNVVQCAHYRAPCLAY